MIKSRPVRERLQELSDEQKTEIVRTYIRDIRRTCTEEKVPFYFEDGVLQAVGLSVDTSSVQLDKLVDELKELSLRVCGYIEGRVEGRKKHHHYAHAARPQAPDPLKNPLSRIAQHNAYAEGWDFGYRVGVTGR